MFFVEDYSPDNIYSELVRYADASLKYITFSDSDDCFTDYYFELVILLLDKGYDVIVLDVQVIYKEEKHKHLSMLMKENVAGKVDIKEILVFIIGCTCGNIYR